jgi:hypothetical protein
MVLHFYSIAEICLTVVARIVHLILHAALKRCLVTGMLRIRLITSTTLSRIRP